MKRSENNIGETDHRSVKLHAPPGGASNFSLAWGDQPQPTNTAVKTAQKNESNFSLGNQEAPKVAQQKPTEAPQPNQDGTSKTSVKVHAPPGGKSSISFG